MSLQSVDREFSRHSGIDGDGCGAVAFAVSDVSEPNLGQPSAIEGDDALGIGVERLVILVQSQRRVAELQVDEPSSLPDIEIDRLQLQRFVAVGQWQGT